LFAWLKTFLVVDLVFGQRAKIFIFYASNNIIINQFALLPLYYDTVW
jgi:hypothetical protein